MGPGLGALLVLRKLTSAIRAEDDFTDSTETQTAGVPSSQLGNCAARVPTAVDY